MTTVTFHMEGERIVGFTVQGHSGYADVEAILSAPQSPAPSA